MTTVEFQKFALRLGKTVNEYLDQFPLRSWFSKRELTRKDYLEITYTEKVPLSRLIDNKLENGGPLIWICFINKSQKKFAIRS